VSYILGSLAGNSNAALTNLLSTFTAQLLPLAKSALAQNFTRYEAYNLFRFNEPKARGARLNELMKRDSKKDFKGATPQYKVYYAACRIAAGLMNATTNPKNAQVNAVAYDAWKMIWAQITPELPSDVKADAESEPAKDNTMLYVAGAAAVALVAFGVARRKGG
jgi:hypothetical protein